MNFHERSGKIVYTLLKPFIRLYSRPANRRVRVLVINDNKEILLVRSWFGRQLWSNPGGGIGWGEDPKAAAVRETKEETGVIVTMSDLKDLGQMQSPNPVVKATLLGFATTANGRIKIKGWVHQFEMLEASWFPLEKLPKNRSELVDELLDRAGYV